MVLTKREIGRIEERLASGARYDQHKEASLWHPRVRQYSEEVERLVAGLRHDWHRLSEQWNQAPLPVPKGSGEGEGHPYDGDPFATNDGRPRIALLQRLGLFAAGAEFVFASYGAKVWLKLPPGKAGVVGLGFAAVYTYVAEGLWGIGPLDHTNPVPEVERREKILWRLGGGIAGLLGAFGVSRFLALPKIFYQVDIGLLSALLPLFAAGCFVLVGLLRERNSLASQYWERRSLFDRLRVILGQIEEILGHGNDQGGRHE